MRLPFKRLFAVGFILLAVVVYVFAPPAAVPAALQRLEFLAYDLRMQYTTPDSFADPRVVVVDIDEQSLQAVGRWPWPRDVFARLVTTLHEDYQAAAIGLDVYFVDEVCRPEEDQQLAASLQEALPVMALSFLMDKDQISGEAGKGVNLQWVSGIQPTTPWWQVASGYIGNLASFVTPDSVSGHIVPVLDEGGSVRRINPVFAWQDHFYDTLALAVVRQFFGADTLFWDDRLEHWLDSPRLHIGSADSPMYMPVNTQGEVLIPYNQPDQQTAYQRVSALEILKGTRPADDIAGHFVLIGSSASSESDYVSTPLSRSLPGVEVHATLLGAMLNAMDGERPFKVQPSNERWLQFMVLLAMAGLLLWSRKLGVWGMVVAAPVLVGLWLAGNGLLWSQFNIAVAILPPVLLATALLVTVTIADLLEINARHQHVRRMFGYYLPEAVVQRLANDRTGTDWLRPERREMTVLFADIQDFTGMAESLDPEVLAAMTHRLFSELTEVIHRHRGTVDKYMGDAVMAFWGAPLPDGDHARHAVQAARAMQSVVARLNEARFGPQGLALRLGIGINTGVMVVGNLGSVQRHAYTVMGAAVNIASGIQQMTRLYPHAILVGESTAAFLSGETSYVDAVKIKRLQQKVSVFSVSDA